MKWAEGGVGKEYKNYRHKTTQYSYNRQQSLMSTSLERQIMLFV